MKTIMCKKCLEFSYVRRTSTEIQVCVAKVIEKRSLSSGM